ncbi:unnamed protein product [Caenorhabditis brenneri]
MARGQKRVGKSNSNTSAAKKLAPESPVASPEVQNDPVPRPETPQTVISPKCFILKHTFDNIPSMADGDYHCGHNEDHFGLNFCLRIVRRDGYLGLYLDEKNAPRQWHLNLEGRLRTLGNKQHDILAMRAMEDPPFYSNGWAKLIKWESISDFLVHNSLIVQFEIRINEMAKLGKKVMRSFDTAMEDVSDVILIVRNQKFYVSKYTLSAHSQYFKALFLGPYKEANMREITLNGVDPFDMQNYLEFLYLQPSITDDTVEGLLLLADQYDTGILKEKCEDFLIKDSKKNLKKKFKMFLKYNCAMEKIIDEIRTYRDYKEMIAGEDVSQMDPKLMSQLLLKSVSFAS